MNFSAVKYWLLLGATLACVYGSFVVWRRQQNVSAALASAEHAAAGQPWTPPAGPPLKEFVLTDENGQPFDSKSLDGNVWVASYFFTNCPGTCWKLNQTLAEIQRKHPDSQVRYVSLTCDPQNDTPEALKKYAEHFHADPARWTFLTGDFKLLRQVANDFFRVGLDRQTHSDRAFVVDRAARPRRLPAHRAAPRRAAGEADRAGRSRAGRRRRAEPGHDFRLSSRNPRERAVNFSVEQLPAVNATLNATAAVLLVAGWVLIKTRRERLHKWAMFTAFGVSIAFLACYLIYHFQVGSVKFQGPANVRAFYLAMLASHVVLAATVPVLAGITIWLGVKDRRQKHRQLARWTFPIWLYVSITGVLIYVMLYHLYPAPAADSIIEGVRQASAGP